MKHFCNVKISDTQTNKMAFSQMIYFSLFSPITLVAFAKYPHLMFMVPCFVDLYYNKPTRCSCAQSILLYCRVTLHVSGAFHTHHQEYTKLYHSLQYRPYYRCSYLLPTWPFIVLQGYSTCFGCFPHPSSGVH